MEKVSTLMGHTMRVLYLTMSPDGSTIVVNTQPPLHELWLAAKSGGRHFRHEAGRWVDTRDGTEFFAALSRSAGEQGGLDLNFTAA